MIPTARRQRGKLIWKRRWKSWNATVTVLLFAAIVYALSWRAGDAAMDTLVYAALAGLIGFLIVEYWRR